MRHRWPLGGVIFILFPSGLGVYIPMSLGLHPDVVKLRSARHYNHRPSSPLIPQELVRCAMESHDDSERRLAKTKSIQGQQIPRFYPHKRVLETVPIHNGVLWG